MYTLESGLLALKANVAAFIRSTAGER